MVDILGADRQLAVCRELTKLHEEIWRGTLAKALQEWRQREPRGEFTLVVAGAAPPSAWDEAQVVAVLNNLLLAGVTSKDAVRQVTAQSGWSRREVYGLAQKIKKAD